ncbi:endonuclease/exonuclease/phosphatase family protein [Nonomuraea sp. GTA35]|uniref:endonuclease/exonuclease/phosphatase family protein n=1 Tax=Nonomuraea sp. GTA35 TaxID=1676746 RepID=UPI0035BF899F
MTVMRAVCATVVLLISALSPLPASASSTATYQIWHWNIAGHGYHLGSTTDGILQAMGGSISGRNPHFVSVNEICHSQYDAMIDYLQKIGWPQNPLNFARYEPMRPADGSSYCAGTGIGQALFSRFPLGPTERHTLPYDGSDKQRKLLCAPIATRTRVKFCTTHLTFDRAYQAAQLTYVRDILDRDHAQGDTVLIAGDFNVQPGDALLDTWYHPGVDTVNNANNSGRYHELDDQDSKCPGWGEQTTESSPTLGACGQPRKVDLIFAAADRLVSYSADSQPIGHLCGANRDKACSDHRMVNAFATVTVAD